MSDYDTPEWAGFVSAMREGDPAERTVPLAAADWLEDRGRADHARFVRGCVRMGELNDVRAALQKAGVRREDDKWWACDHEVFGLIDDLRPLINRHCHEWTGGAKRTFESPTPYDWPNGFVRAWRAEGDPRKLPGLLRRQPVRTVRVPVGFIIPSAAAVFGVAFELIPGFATGTGGTVRLGGRTVPVGSWTIRPA